jgi:hypothetical protein
MMAIEEQAKRIRRAASGFLRSIAAVRRPHGFVMPGRAAYPARRAALRLYEFPRGFRQR